MPQLMAPSGVVARRDVDRLHCASYRKQIVVQRKNKRELMMARARKRVRREWTAEDVRELKKHSKSKTPVAVISKAMKRTPVSLRQKAFGLGIPLGHRR